MLDSLIVPNLNIGIIDGTSPNFIQPQLVGVERYEVNWGDTYDTAQLANQKSAGPSPYFRKFEVGCSLLN